VQTQYVADDHCMLDFALPTPRLQSRRTVIDDADVAIAPLVVLAGAVAAVLLAFAHGYGYHRDELYFLAAGHHLALAYPDQGVLTPLIAHVMSAIAPGSLTMLRLPSALMTAGTVLATGLTAFEFGGGRRAQIIASMCAAVSSVVLTVGHLLSTTTFDLLAWAVVCWLVVRILRTGEKRLWLGVGLTAGLALLNKPLIAALCVVLGLALLSGNSRHSLRSPWLVGALGITLAFAAPWLIWQAGHDWPQLHISSSIASGGSASSQPRWAFLPFQLLLVSPVLAPVWIVGLVDLLRRPALRRFRAMGFTWLGLAALFLIAGGKPYYLAGMFPVLIAAGSLRTDEWTASRRRRSMLLVGALALSGVVSATIALPLLPARDAGPVVAMNADIGETIGWPEFATSVQQAYERAGARAVIFTVNYGEAGAIDRLGPALGLPTAYSGHNGFAEWGPPPARAGATVVVGMSETRLRRWFAGCVLAGRVENVAGISNEEEGVSIDICSRPRQRWSAEWEHLRHLS
jgi:4-amino-4-deoxy-L-arabinose transferase-like glycosyltransferase